MTSAKRAGALVLAGLLLAARTEAHGQIPGPSEREVTFRSGEVALQGTLLLPPGMTAAPAVVFLHGSGPATREGARAYAQEFARIGVASLFFDKRGAGASGGSWLTSSLDDLAGDALAAVKYLKSQRRIDSTRIGFWGVSQAAWVAPLAASRSPDVAFMILISGGGASPRESEVFSYERAFAQAGFSPEEQAKGNEIVSAYFAYLATGGGRGALTSRFDSIRASRLQPLAEQLERVLPSEENRKNWAWVATHDPAPIIAGVKCPVLLLFGERDNDHPTALSVARWRDGLAKAGNDRVTLMVFPGAGHGIRMREGHTGSGRAPFADGYADAQLGWLFRNVVAPDREREPRSK